MNELAGYISENWLELTAALLGVVAIFLQIKINSFYWIVSILNVALYIWVYISQKLYALMILMIYYVGMSVYGWFVWRFGEKRGDSQHRLRISHTRLRTWIILVIITAISFLVISWILYSFTDSATPIPDGLVTALSFVATWMLARKKIENWLVWLLVDIISCYLYFNQKMYPTLVLYIILCVMAVIGYMAWKNKMKNAEV